MCVVSMIMDYYWYKWRLPYDSWNIQPYPPSKAPTPLPTQDEIDEFRKLLERAREYDKRNNEPDCELKEKRERLLDLAGELGIKIDFL